VRSKILIRSSEWSEVAPLKRSMVVCSVATCLQLWRAGAGVQLSLAGSEVELEGRKGIGVGF
jgi:hypothetical protein